MTYIYICREQYFHITENVCIDLFKCLVKKNNHLQNTLNYETDCVLRNISFLYYKVVDMQINVEQKNNKQFKS